MTQATAAAEIKAFVTGAARNAYETLAPQFERATGHKLVTQFDLPPALIKKIDAGEPFDVIILSYDVEGLIKQGKVVADFAHRVRPRSASASPSARARRSRTSARSTPSSVRCSTPRPSPPRARAAADAMSPR